LSAAALLRVADGALNSSSSSFFSSSLPLPLSRPPSSSCSSRTAPGSLPRHGPGIQKVPMPCTALAGHAETAGSKFCDTRECHFSFHHPRIWHFLGSAIGRHEALPVFLRRLLWRQRVPILTSLSSPDSWQLLPPRCFVVVLDVLKTRGSKIFLSDVPAAQRPPARARSPPILGGPILPPPLLLRGRFVARHAAHRLHGASPPERPLPPASSLVLPSLPSFCLPPFPLSWATGWPVCKWARRGPLAPTSQAGELSSLCGHAGEPRRAGHSLLIAPLWSPVSRHEPACCGGFYGILTSHVFFGWPSATAR